jgi:hypothetical protein
VQLVSASTKSRRKIYTQVERKSFHTASVKRRNTRGEQMFRFIRAATVANLDLSQGAPTGTR